MHRRLRQTSRKSFWPMIVSCSPSEDGSIYGRMLVALRDGLAARGLPMPSSISLDWFDGSRIASASTFPRIQLRFGVEHMRRNLKSNQSAGTRPPRQAAPKAAGRGRARAQAKPKAKAKAKARPPHLEGNRPIWAVLALVRCLLFVPTDSMLHVFLTVILDRIRRVWLENRWAAYWEKEYLCWRDVPMETYGVARLFTALWWSGLGSCKGFQSVGHPSSQQTAEAANAKMKRDLRSQGEIRKHQDVILALEKCLPTWLAPLSPADEATNEPISMMGDVRLGRPSCPDQWMYHEGANLRMPAGGHVVAFASIELILHKMRSCRRRLPHETWASGNAQYVAMAIGHPEEIPRGTLQKMRAQLRTKKIADLQQLLQADGLLYQENDDGPFFDKDQYEKLWQTWCLVWCVTEADGSYDIRCTCWAHAWRGHCVHQYACEQFWDKKTHVGQQIPPVQQDVVRAGRRSRSEEAQAPRARLRR